MTNKNEMIQPEPMLQLPAVNMSQLHPHARERFVRFLKELRDEVPLDQLSDEDFTAQELVEFVECVRGVEEWLDKCREEAYERARKPYKGHWMEIDPQADPFAVYAAGRRRRDN